MRVEEVVALLRQACDEVGGYYPWAQRHRLSRQYVREVLVGLKPPSDRIAKALGLRPDGMRWVRK